MRTLTDTEDGSDLGILQDVRDVARWDAEHRRDSDGHRRGRRGHDDRSYDQRQIAPRDEPSEADVSGNAIGEP